MNNIVSLSGGKDSTAMLLMMLERKEPIYSIVFFDTGWEFPQMIDHINLLEKRIGREIVRLQHHYSFDHWMFERKVVPRKGPLKGHVRFVGLGWPRADFRWCTGKKTNRMDKYKNQVPDAVMNIGFAADEAHRCTIKTETQKKRYQNSRFPLVEWGITEEDALNYCFDKGYEWGGLYEYFSRVSCFCCPLQRLNELRALYKHHPDMWARLRDMDERNRTSFRENQTVKDLEERFYHEGRQMKLFGT